MSADTPKPDFKKVREEIDGAPAFTEKNRHKSQAQRRAIQRLAKSAPTVSIYEARVAQAMVANPTGSLGAIARAAGMSKSRALEMLKTPNVRDLVCGVLDAAGATLKKTAETIAAGHDATKIVFNLKTGEKIGENPEWIARLKAAELNLRARRLVSAPGDNPTPTPTQSLFALINAARASRGLPALQDEGA